MKIAKIEDLHADLGWRTISFLKIVTADGIVGWSEYAEGVGNLGLTGVIRALSEKLIGMDPLRVEAVAAQLNVLTNQCAGGINQQAIAAITNALLDIKGKALGVPVRALFGGPLRDRLPLYWSHCGSYRVRYAEFLGCDPVRSYDDISRLGEEVRRRGFRALKTNILISDGKKLSPHRPGSGATSGFPELNVSPAVLNSFRPLVEAFRAGAGPDMGVMVDVNFHFKTEGFLQIARAVAPLGLTWLELDTYDPAALALIRQQGGTPLASCESIYTRRGYRPYLENRAVDVAIVDVIWNGYLEAMKIASLAEAHEVNVAPHNYFGVLADCISANFAAAVPNLRMLEIDVDGVPWKADFVTQPPVVENGELVLSDRPGWGTDIDEKAVRARPPRH